MRWLSLAGTVSMACLLGACGPTVFKGPTGPDTNVGTKLSTGSEVPQNPVELPFAVQTRSRNGITRLHSQLVDGDFVSSGVMVASTKELTKPLARIDDARQIYSVGGTPDDFYVFSETLIGASVRRVKGGVVGPSMRASGAENYRSVAVDEQGAFALVENKSAPQPYAKARVDLVTDGAKPSGLSIAPQYCWDTVGARSGEVLLAGRACREADGRLVVQRFTAGAKVGTLDKLPGDFPSGVKVKDVHLHAQKTGIFVTATLVTGSTQKPYAAKWDGKAWSQVDVPEQFNDILSFSEGKDGSLFVVESQVAARSAQVWRREPKLGWRPVPLPRLREVEHYVYSKISGKYLLQKPPQFIPLTVSARALDDVWVAASIEDGEDLVHSLLHKTPAATLVEWPDMPRPPETPLDECKSTFFVALGPVPPSHNSYAEIRRLLAGHFEIEGLSLIETVEGGRHVHGIHHTSQAAAARIVELLGKGNIKGPIRCTLPAATRVVPFKLATGELGNEEVPEHAPGGDESGESGGGHE